MRASSGGGANTYRYVHDVPVASTDPYGLFQGTFQLGGSVNVSLGPVNFQYSGGFVVDASGNLGVYNTYTPLPGGSFPNGDVSNVGWPNSPRYYPLSPRPGSNPPKSYWLGIGVSAAASDAYSICDLSKEFVSASVGGGEGLSFSGDGFAGNSPHGRVVGGGATAGTGLGTPARATLNVTQTTITSITGRKHCQ
jgi:hypothetical protein